MVIKRVQIADIGTLAPLFDAYRIFYGKTSNIDQCNAYLNERFAQQEAEAYIAFDNDIPIGFTLLYPFFSSVNCAKVVVLNDLYVDESHRSKGVARSLIDEVKTYAQNIGALRVELGTEVTNLKAQRLYDKYGFKKETDYYYYSLMV